MAFCPTQNSVPFNDKCYEVITDQPKNFIEAQDHCHASGGHLAEITNQKVNNFLSDYALMHSALPEFWTGGVLTTVAGLQIGIWHDSKKAIGIYQ
jgi:hypothetical protein